MYGDPNMEYYGEGEEEEEEKKEECGEQCEEGEEDGVFEILFSPENTGDSTLSYSNPII